jgi:DNA-binding response OmpR family regulator
MAAEPTSVLFVTADPVLAAVYRLRLEIDEYSIRWVEPGAALEAVAAAEPDLVYVDADSPGVDQLLLASLRVVAAPLILITRRPEPLLRRSLPASLEPYFVLSLAHPEGVAV